MFTFIQSLAITELYHYNHLQISVLKLLYPLGPLALLLVVLGLAGGVVVHAPLIVPAQPRHAVLQPLQLQADPAVLLVVELPVVPLLGEEVGQHVQGGARQEVSILLHHLYNFLRFINKCAPALGHQAASQLHFVHFLKFNA